MTGEYRKKTHKLSNSYSLAQFRALLGLTAVRSPGKGRLGLAKIRKESLKTTQYLVIFFKGHCLNSNEVWKLISSEQGSVLSRLRRSYLGY